VDVKGNNYTVQYNHGTNAQENGFRVTADGGAPGDWGYGNVFVGNAADVNASGYGFLVASSLQGSTIIGCDNVVTGAASGFANVECR
jgi:hypothetical protein